MWWKALARGASSCIMQHVSMHVTCLVCMAHRAAVPGAVTDRVDSRCRRAGESRGLPDRRANPMARKGKEQMAQSTQMRLAVLGAGKMGGILIEAFVKQDSCRRRIFSPRSRLPRPSERMRRDFAGRDNRAAAKNADVIFLCVKPQTVAQVVEEIAPELNAEKLMISVAASVPTDYIERRWARMCR